MNARALYSRILIAAGLVGLLLGAIDPLEGSFVILPSVAVVALGALVGHSRQRAILVGSFVLVAFGVAAMVVLSVLGGIGGDSGRSLWWGVFILPYPVGWAVGVVSGGIALFESWKFHSLTRQASR